MPGTLHLVDGDCTGGTIRASRLAKSKDILRWRDALYTGPVPAGLSFRQLSRLRSRFWTRGKSSSEFDKRDAALRKHAQYDHVVLWFSSNCVLCQLSLIQVLSWFREQGVSASRLSWVALHGGELRPEEIESACARQRRITPPQMLQAERAWRAFREPTPSAMVRLIHRKSSAIPGLRAAFLHLSQEYPSERNGLSRLEAQLLREISKRGSAKAAIAVGSIIARETVGDLLLFDMLRDFVGAPHPLLEFAEPFHGNTRNWQFNASVLKLTAFGKSVLSGKADHIAANGIDRWIGGVHLQGQKLRWRWKHSRMM